MKNETFLNEKYQIINNGDTAHKEVLCTFIFKNKQVKRFYLIETKKDASNAYYINIAKEKFNDEKNNGRLVAYSNRFLHSSSINANRIGVIAGGVAVAAAVALAVALPLTLNFGGSSAQEKVNKVLDSAIEKVDAFNKTLANIETKEDSNNSLVSGNKTIYASYQNLNESGWTNRALEEEQFGLYIFNNIYYCFRDILPDNNLPIGSVITGTTLRLPDINLQRLWDQMHLPATTLSAKLELENDGVAFQADWDFRNEILEHAEPQYAMFNIQILTTGKIFYDFATNKIQRINLNYYWTEPHRIFCSFNYDYTTNKFNLALGQIGTMNVNHNWSYDTTDKRLTDEWNDGTLTYDKLLTHGYNYYFVVNGNIADNKDGLQPVGYLRYVSENKTSGEDTIIEKDDLHHLDEFKNAYEAAYQTNKDVKIRTEKEAIDLKNAHKVNIDDCVRCGEARTKIFWLYKITEQGYYTFDKSLVPYLGREELISHLAKMIEEPGSLSADQIALLTKAKQYLSSISDGKYFGEVIAADNAGFTYNYDIDSTQSYRYNVFTTYYFSYLLTDATNPNVKVNFIIDNTGEPVIGGYYGARRVNHPITYDGFAPSGAMIELFAGFTQQPTSVIFGSSAQIAFKTTRPLAKEEFESVYIEYKISTHQDSIKQNWPFTKGENEYLFYVSAAELGEYSINILSIGTDGK